MDLGCPLELFKWKVLSLTETQIPAWNNDGSMNQQMEPREESLESKTNPKPKCEHRILGAINITSVFPWKAQHTSLSCHKIQFQHRKTQSSAFLLSLWINCLVSALDTSSSFGSHLGAGPLESALWCFLGTYLELMGSSPVVQLQRVLSLTETQTPAGEHEPANGAGVEHS